MDHVGDMLGYIQQGLEAQGYSGILSWKGIDRYKDSVPESDDWVIVHRDNGQAIMWAKDAAFRVTIECIDYGQPLDLTLHADTATGRISSTASG